MTEAKGSTEIAKRDTAGVVRSAGSAVDTFEDYRKMQHAIDNVMPEAIMKISGKAFRRKPYWRAIARGFNLTVECIKEESQKQDFIGGNDWGFIVTYRATAPNGCSADGDGACFASEKKAANQRTAHNIRSHAHTRAFNRAVSNLVGFGEVSAEEAERDDDREEPGSYDGPPSEQPPQTRTAAPDNLITEPQRRRLYAISKRAQESQGWSDQDLKDKMAAFLKSRGFDSSTDITRAEYDYIVTEVTSWA